jgi:hypothetical protein
MSQIIRRKHHNDWIVDEMQLLKAKDKLAFDINIEPV